MKKSESAPKTVNVITTQYKFRSGIEGQEMTVMSPEQVKNLLVKSVIQEPFSLTKEVDTNVFKDSLDGILSTLKETFSSSFDQEFGKFSIEEVEIHLDITGEGKVGFLSSGVQLQGSTGIKVVFKRS